MATHHQPLIIIPSVPHAQVKHLKKGDRVVACFDIGCSHCAYCKGGMFSSCSTTNPR